MRLLSPWERLPETRSVRHHLLRPGAAGRLVPREPSRPCCSEPPDDDLATLAERLAEKRCLGLVIGLAGLAWLAAEAVLMIFHMG